MFLPGGQPPAVGSVVRNPDLARTYAGPAPRNGVGWLYRGALGRAVVATAQDPPTAARRDACYAGQITTGDLARVPGARAGPDAHAGTAGSTSTACRCRRRAGSPSARR